MIYSNNWNPPLPTSNSFIQPESTYLNKLKKDLGNIDLPKDDIKFLNSALKDLGKLLFKVKAGGVDLDDKFSNIYYDKNGPVPFPFLKSPEQEIQPIIFIDDLENGLPF